MQVVCVCLRIVVSNTYCIVFLLCVFSYCAPYVASFSGLSTFHCPLVNPFGILHRLLTPPLVMTCMYQARKVCAVMHICVRVSIWPLSTILILKLFRKCGNCLVFHFISYFQLKGYCPKQLKHKFNVITLIKLTPNIHVFHHHQVIAASDFYP